MLPWHYPRPALNVLPLVALCQVAGGDFFVVARDWLTLCYMLWQIEIHKSVD
jgi:hypothetical protein